MWSSGRIVWAKPDDQSEAWPAMTLPGPPPAAAQSAASSDCMMRVFWYGKHTVTRVSRITVSQAPGAPAAMSS